MKLKLLNKIIDILNTLVEVIFTGLDSITNLQLLKFKKKIGSNKILYILRHV